MLGAGETNSIGFSAPELPSSQIGDRQRGFAKVMAIENRKDDGLGGAPTAPEEARDAAERLVSATFIEPLLKQMRETSDAAPPFAMTRAEKQLRALADTMTAQSIVQAAQMPLVDRIAADLLARSAAGEGGS